MLLILAACDSESVPSPAELAPIRLATLRHAASGSHPQVPTAVVGRTRRPVLAGWPHTLLLRAIVPATPSRPQRLEVPLAEAMRAGPIRLDGLVTFLDTALPDNVKDIVRNAGRVLGQAGEQHVAVTPEIVERPAASATVTLTIPAASTTGDALVEVHARPVEDVWASEPIEIPAGAVLRFGLGVSGDESATDLGASAATVSVVDGDATASIFTQALSDAGFARDRWNDRQVDLAAYSGRTVRLRFTVTTPQGAAPPPVEWSDPTILVPPTHDSTRPNLVLISLDTLRPDRLGAYGHERPTSPTIDAWLAARGTVFEDATTPFPNTAGSHMTMLTAVDPCVHGLDRTAFGGGKRVRDEVVTLAEVLRDAGYETAAFTEDAWVTAAVGYDRGFGTFVEDHGMGFNDGNVEVTFRRGSEWIRAHRRQPFFVFLHTYQVHEPYTPPPGYTEQVAHAHGDTRAERELALYDGEVRYTDDVLAGFLAALDADGVAARTLVLVVADHGQHFGEHGAWGHSLTLYEPVLRVPMILRGPGVPAGRRVPDPVGLIDIVPTVLELLGVQPPAEIQGWSLVPTLHGAPLPPRLLYSELPERGLLSARRGTLKLLVNEKSGTTTAVDLATDPHENRNILASLPAGYAEEVARDRREHCRRGEAGAKHAESPPAIGGAVRRKLEALGYTE